MRDRSEEFLTIYETHADAIFRYCYVRLRDREAAKDAVQETFLRTWRWLNDGNEAESIRAVLYRTAMNITVDEYRRRRTDSLDAMLAQGFDVPDHAVPSPLLAARLSEAMALVSRLEPAYRDVLMMRHVEDMPVKEIAAVLGENENAVSVRIHRAIKQLNELHHHA